MFSIDKVVEGNFSLYEVPSQKNLCSLKNSLFSNKNSLFSNKNSCCRDAFEAALGCKKNKVGLSVRTTVRPDNCTVVLDATVMHLAPLEWVVVRSEETSIQDFVNFLTINMRALSELECIRVEWQLEVGQWVPYKKGCRPKLRTRTPGRLESELLE